MGRSSTWLLLIYRVPQEPASRRTYVWRQLKGLGAVYLQQAAAVLPDLPEARQALEALSGRIAEFGGQAFLLEASAALPPGQAALVERFNQARDAEYAEIVETIERLEDEIKREAERGKFTYAELEELEADWERIGRWHERVRARDTFGAAGASVCGEALEAVRHSLDAFTERVYAREGLAEPDLDPTEPPG